MGKQQDVPPEVFQITNADEALTLEQSRRMRKYLIQMGIRIACFVGAFVVWTVAPNPIVISVLIAAAVILPYLAVIEVNAGRERGIATEAFINIDPLAQISNNSSVPDDDYPTAEGSTAPSSTGSRRDAESPSKIITIESKSSRSKQEDP